MATSAESSVHAESLKEPLAFFAPGHLFSVPELWALNIDGLITPVIGDVFVPVNTRFSPKVRAVAMTHLLPAGIRDKVILGKRSAAWIWSGYKDPRIHCLLYTAYNRLTLRKPLRHFNVSLVNLPPHDIHTFSLKDHFCSSTLTCRPYLKVTSFERTIYDLLLQEPPGTAISLINAMLIKNPHQQARRTSICTLLYQRIQSENHSPSQKQKARKTLKLLNRPHAR